MCLQKALFLSILFALLFCLLQSAAQASAIDDWQKYIQEGSHSKFDGQYNAAFKSYTKALNIAETQKLPPKYLPISLCRLADVEVIISKVNEADTHFSKIVEIIKQQKAENILDPQVSFWAAVLSDSYLSKNLPESREKCLKRACYLKEIIYGDGHNECIGCLNKLAEYLVQEGKVDKAIRILTLTHEITEKKLGRDPNKNKDGLGDPLHNLALKCRTQHKFLQAKELELEVIRLAKLGNGYLKAGLPAFYSFLGMNEFAQGDIVQGKNYFSIARQECIKVKNIKNKDLVAIAKGYRLSLVPSFLQDAQENKLFIEETELNEIISMTKLANSDPREQFQFLSALSVILANEKKYDKAAYSRQNGRSFSQNGHPFSFNVAT
jgi:hypothetical protein